MNDMRPKNENRKRTCGNLWIAGTREAFCIMAGCRAGDAPPKDAAIGEATHCQFIEKMFSDYLEYNTVGLERHDQKL
jgi:hypothetical protein